MFLEKYAEEIQNKEAELGRELSDIEKEAVWGAIMKGVGIAAKAAKNFTPAKIMTWGKEIAGAAREAQGASKLTGTIANKARAGFNASKVNNPVLHYTTLSATGAGASAVAGGTVGGAIGLMTNKKQSPPQPMQQPLMQQPMQPRYASEEVDQEKVALLTDEQSDRLKMLLGGAGVGAGLGVGSVLFKRHLDGRAVATATEPLRDFGTSLRNIQAYNKNIGDTEFNALFDSVEDINIRRGMQNVISSLKDDIKRTYDSGKIPGRQAFNKEVAKNYFNNLHLQGHIPLEVRDHMHNYIDRLR